MGLIKRIFKKCHKFLHRLFQKNKEVMIIGDIFIENCAMAMDGGSIVFLLKDDNGTKFELNLPQYQLEGNFADKIPGRIHLNNRPIEVRSPEESHIIEKLSLYIEKNQLTEKEKVAPPENRLILSGDINAYFKEIDKGPEYATNHLVKEVIKFVESDAYLAVAHKMKKQYID